MPYETAIRVMASEAELMRLRVSIAQKRDAMRASAVAAEETRAAILLADLLRGKRAALGGAPK